MRKRLQATLLALALLAIVPITLQAHSPTDEGSSATPSSVGNEVQAHLDRGDALAAQGKFISARDAYEAAAEILRAEGQLPAKPLRRIANSYYYEARYQTAGSVLLDLADEAAEFGDVVTQVWATADAAWVAGVAGHEIDAERRLARLEKLLTSPYLPDAVRAEVINKRLDARPGEDAVAALSDRP